MIDLDDNKTYPQEIKAWVLQMKEYFMKQISTDSYKEDYEVEHKLWDMRIEEMEFVQDYLEANKETEVAVWHNTRILNEDEFREEGIRTFGGDIEYAKERVKKVIEPLLLSTEKQEELIKSIMPLWERDKESRTKAVHFFYSMKQIHNPQLMEFASNLGGECVRWGLESIDAKMYRQEPYKRLWIWGRPCSVKFKVIFDNIDRRSREHIVRGIIIYYVMTEIYGLGNTIEDTGATICDIAPKDIIRIDQISNFELEQGRFEAYQNFY
jgi:hypothetical protein